MICIYNYIHRAIVPIKTKENQTMENRINTASDILYRWACDLIPTSDAKEQCKRLAGCGIDFRQPDYGYIEALDLMSTDGAFVKIHF